MNWAILATGTIAAKFAETVNGMKGEDRLAACGSRSREKAEAFGKKYGIPRTYGSYEELLRDEEVDAGYVPSSAGSPERETSQGNIARRQTRKLGSCQPTTVTGR